VLGSQTIEPDHNGRAFIFMSFDMWFVYICDRNGQLYTGITTDLDHRMSQHKAEILYSEKHPDKYSAAKRERQVKNWRREKKLALINNSQ